MWTKVFVFIDYLKLLGLYDISFWLALYVTILFLDIFKLIISVFFRFRKILRNKRISM